MAEHNTAASNPAAPNKNVVALERTMRLIAALTDAGEDGLSAQRLIRVAGYPADAKDAGSQLTREFRHLRNAGWQIDSVGAVGEDGHYVLRNVDVRLRVLLSPDQRAALRRAAMLAHRADLGDRLGVETGSVLAEETTAAAATVSTVTEESLRTVMSALSAHRLLHFRYKHQQRAVHPMAVRVSGETWYLQGRETPGAASKSFRISRMSQVWADDPGTAEVIHSAEHTSLQPMHWLVDPPVEVRLRTPQEFVPDVIRWLTEPARVSEPDAEGRVVMTYTVTHRAALRARLYELGTRVEVLGPIEVRDEILTELATVAGEA